MNSLEDHLYSYLMEHLSETEKNDGEYRLAQELRDSAQEELCATMTAAQKHLLSHYMDQENYLSSLELHRMFRVTLALLRGELC